MKSLVPILATVLLGAATAAAADPSAPGSIPQRERAVMLYFTKSFGSTQRQNRAPLAFGLRLQQSSTFDPSLSFAVADLRYSLGGKAQLDTLGVFRLGEGEIGVEGSSSTSKFYREHPVLAWGMTAAAAAGAACAFQLGICKSNGGYRQVEDPQTGRN